MAVLIWVLACTHGAGKRAFQFFLKKLMIQDAVVNMVYFNLDFNNVN